MENMNYSQAVARLEEIMAAVQSGSLDVDSLSVMLKEASTLVAFCRARLYKVDEEVKTLLQEFEEK